MQGEGSRMAASYGMLIWGMLAFGLSAEAQVQPAATLRNAGFEEGLEGWTAHVFGAQSTIVRDDQVAHQGKQSLRISSQEASDTALGQEVQLKPGHYYRFTGWVRTRGLDPLGSPVYGTFQIQHTGGKQII